MYDGGYMGVGLDRKKNKKEKMTYFPRKHGTQNVPLILYFANKKCIMASKLLFRTEQQSTIWIELFISVLCLYDATHIELLNNIPH